MGVNNLNVFENYDPEVTIGIYLIQYGQKFAEDDLNTVLTLVGHLTFPVHIYITYRAPNICNSESQSYTHDEPLSNCF